MHYGLAMAHALRASQSSAPARLGIGPLIGELFVRALGAGLACSVVILLAAVLLRLS